jgi:dTDP-4-amino-4,6-dideoxygalactose transaminase
MAETIPHNRLTFSEAECEAVARTVRSGHWAQGPRVQELEAALARLGEVKYAVCVASGLSALRLSLGALGIGSSHSVVVPAYSCVALANAALAWGATPVPIDIEPRSWNLCQAACSDAVSAARPHVVIAVNTFGVPVEIDEIIADGLPVIEDCAHAFGITVGGKWLGSRTQVGVLSFYATKLIGGGEGGAVLTDSAEIAASVGSARDYADQPAAAHRLNDKMNDLEAALVLAQLPRLPEFISAREKIAQRYLDMLSDSSAHGRLYRLPAPSKERVWYRFVVEMLKTSARTIVDGLRAFGINAALPMTDWRPAGSLPSPVADRAYRQLVSLPLYPTLTTNEQDCVVKAFLKASEDFARG